MKREDDKPNYTVKEPQYRRNMPDKQKVFPITKMTMRRSPVPLSQRDPNVIRLQFLERPTRYYFSLTYHQKAFIKTVLLSFVLIVPSYHTIYYFARMRSKAEILGKMDAGYTSDSLKNHIVDFKKRKEQGLVETYDASELRRN